MPRNIFTSKENGWKFSNASLPVYRYKLPIFPFLKWGKAERGICGGMVFSALDYYYAGKKIPDIKQLEIGDSNLLFRYIIRRLFHSFQWKAVFLYYILQHPFSSPSFLNKNNRKQIEKILHQLRNHQPVPVTLILIRSVNPDRLGENHQVLLTKILAEEDDKIILGLYDPNFPEKEREISIYFHTKKEPRIEMQGQKIWAIYSLKYKKRNPF